MKRRPATRKSGIRVYGEQELANIEFVVCMRSAGLPIKVLSQYLSFLEQGDSTKQERLKLLQHQKENLEQKVEELNKALDKLDYKIGLLSKKE